MLNNKKIWNVKFKKKKWKNNKLEIVEAKVVEVEEEGLLLEITDGRKAKCRFLNISDFDFSKISNRFQIGSFHNFVLVKYDEINDIYFLNYKMIHPMEIKDKRRSVPTISHDRNLRKFLKFILKKDN